MVIDGKERFLFHIRGGVLVILNGQGGSYIHYAHELLVNNQIVCLLEKDNIWYYPDHDNNMVELFECAPESIETYNDF